MHYLEMDRKPDPNVYTEPGNAITNVLFFLQNLYIFEKNFIEEVYPTADNEFIRLIHLDNLRKSLIYKLPDGTTWSPK